MSSQKVRKVQRFLPYTATWLAGVLTVTTATHYLTSTNTVSFRFNDSPQELNNVAVTVTSGTQFTIVLADENQVQKVGVLVVDFYGPSQTGAQLAFTLPRANGINTVVQSYVKGTGGAAYTINVSLDGVHWTANPSGGTLTHAGTTDDTKYEVILAGWGYMQIVPSAIGAATQLYVNVSN